MFVGVTMGVGEELDVEDGLATVGVCVVSSARRIAAMCILKGGRGNRVVGVKIRG